MMSTRLRTAAALAAIGLTFVFWPHQARAADAKPSAAERAKEAADKERQEAIVQTQITYASIGGGVLGVAVLAFVVLANANKKAKVVAEQRRRERLRAGEDVVSEPFIVPPAE